MALNGSELWSNGFKIAFFPKILQKLSIVWGLQTLIVSGWGIRPQIAVCDTFELH